MFFFVFFCSFFFFYHRQRCTLILLYCQLLHIIPGMVFSRQDSHMKSLGMLVVLHRGINQGFWSHLYKCVPANKILGVAQHF